jgi:ribosomal protein S13
MYLKAHHPLEFACASLRHAKDEDQSIQILRDLDKEGYQYKIYDKKESRLDWEVKDGKLVGALTNIKGVGIKTAEEIIRKRENNIDLTERQEKLVTDGVTPYDSIFQTRVLWGHVLNDPEKYGVKMPISMIESIQENSVGTFLILAKIDELVLKNINAPEKVVERGGKVMPGDPHYLLCKAIDDTGKITLVFNRKDYQSMGRQLKDEHKVNDYYLILGESSQGFKTLNVVRYKKITDNEDYKL